MEEYKFRVFNIKTKHEVFITGVVVYTEYALFAIEDLTGKQLSFYYFENCLIEIVGNNYEGLKLVKECLT